MLNSARRSTASGLPRYRREIRALNIVSWSCSSNDRSVASRFGADRYFVKPSSFDFMKIGEMVFERLAQN